ncbi:sciellin isoform X7 [Dicentrarchus labrax]|uniref:LIM zinc-binding domain-containing protein n=1 Tax=Dicentrarchus labrax TaxID=13489 RepID=A0A8C4D8I3_DICLA|nr:sciellin isoform X4 [Dicentrarchus labrax]XP_051260584.1 sciellin isoform X5 [Dicentrarchus labrax]XP_051260585.1 sciellin isoform X6 [Dicentrarchus labrax]XP_051260586.1 sciellin isoform X7 [Dicentrarchus labrax]
MSRFSATKNSLLQDNSWIRKTDDEDEDVDRDPNFGKIVLSQYRSTENLVGSEPEEVPTTKPIRTSTTSVQALSKRFSGSQDELRSSPLPSSKPMSSYTKSTYSSLKSDSPKTTTTTTVTKDGTTITSTKSLRSPVITSPTTTFTERVKSSSKGAQYSTYSPTRTTKVTETTVTSSKDPEDKLYDSLIPPSIKDDFSPTDSKTTVSSTETVTVKSSPDGDSIKTTTTTRTSSLAEDKLYDSLIPSSIKDDFSPTDSKTTVFNTETVTVKSSPDRDSIKTTTTTRTSSTAEDNLYDTLLPKSITSSPVRGESPTLSSPSSTRRTTSYSSYTDDIPSTRTTSYTISTKPSEDYSSDLKTYSYSRPDSSYEYSSITSPSVYTSPSYRSNSRSDDILADPIYSKSSTKSVYASPERAVLEKDLCTYCHKPFNADAKMVLDDLKINCHASCFKCAVCNSTLGHMKAGDSMWIYKRMVHCENCFEVTREKWRR